MAAVQAYPASPPTLHSSDEVKPNGNEGEGAGEGVAYEKHAGHVTTANTGPHTPPTTDEGSHKDDDAASSSSLSDLDENADIDVDIDVNMGDFDDEQNRQRFEDAARAGAEAEQHAQIKPHHFEGGIPVFQPTMDEFRDFKAFMTQADAYGMQSGIIKIVPPQEWKAARKPLDELVKHVRIKNPLTQEFHGAQGIYTQRNMEKSRSYNLPQWKATCEQTENQPPARRGEKRMNADKLLGRGSARKKSEGTPTPETTVNGKRRGRPPKKRDSTIEPDSSLVAPPTPTSPENKPVTIKVEEGEEEEKREETPGPVKRGRKPKGRQPKSTVKKEPGAGKSTETTVASRRLRNAREAVDVVDEEAFKDFDYRTYDHDQWTQERCDELEEKYWKSLNFSNPMYAADMPGSLFDEDTKEWNVAKLPNLLDMLGAPIPGVNTAYLYLGMWRATFAWHLEDVDLYSINYIHFGAPKQWYSISQKDAPKFENAMKQLWPSDAKNCDQFLRHKTYLVSPAILKSKYGVEVNKIVHREGEFIVTYPIGYHSGYNLGYNCAESVNFAIENWLNYGKTARKCQCEADSVFIDVDWFIRRLNGEPSPEYEEIEITDDEDEGDEIGTPVPGAGRGKTAQKRKRQVKDSGPNKKAKKIVKIRKVSKNQPCALCPNDFPWEELLPTTNNQRAHRVCAMYTPETYIASVDGAEKVFNVEGISKARLDLRCHECKQKKGSCFQCSSAKCTRAYHATCAMHAGVQVDKGDIAVWHDGVEYRDIGFDWRCRLHRTVKRSRITSELSTLNHSHDWSINKEMHEHITGLVPGDVIQWQAFHGDEILAGVVEHQYDPGQGSLIVSVLPEKRMVREVDPAWILFVDSSTSCLQRPSANALDLPEDLQGKTAQVPGSTEKKPSEGDPFTEDPKTEWAEFVVEPPPHNKWQKKIDFSKVKQILYYLGKSSTDTKAQYTANPAKPVYDPSCNFLETVDTPKMAPPPQPKRHSLAASYPMINFAARNATIQTMRQQVGQQSPAPPRTTMGPKSESIMNAAREEALKLERTGQSPKPSQYRDIIAAAEARANEQARIAQRHQQVQQQHQYAGQGSFQANNGMNIDQSAAARQRQFQQQESQQSRSMSGSSQHGSPQQSPPLPLYTTQASMTAFRPYNNVQPSFYSNGDARYGMMGFTPQGMQYTHDWMNPPGRPPIFPSPAMPTMESNSPELAFKQPAKFTQSPTTLSGSPMLAASDQHSHAPSQSHMQPGQPFLGVSAVSRGTGGTPTPSLKKEASSIDSIGTTMSALPPPRTPSEAERQRRISNPSWPFKSPEQIMAQKGERDKSGSQSSGSRPVSRPGSGYSTKAFPSPRIHAMPYGPEPQPPMYINPTATQLPGPPQGTAHSRAKSMSVSGLNRMGPPIQHPPVPPFRRSMSSSNLAPMQGNMQLDFTGLRHDFVNQVNRHMPVFGPQPMPPPSRSRRSTMNSCITPQLGDGPVEPPSPDLQSSLESRPTTRSGTPVNDRPPPAAISSWQNHPGFWGKIASYFLRKHESSATVYKSPFGVGSTSNSDLPGTISGPSSDAMMRMQGASTIGNDEGLAGRWLCDLEMPDRHVVEHWKGENPLGMRP